MVMPGEDSQVQLKLVKQMVIEPNQQFTIRAGTSTIGTGKVVEPSRKEFVLRVLCQLNVYKRVRKNVFSY